MDIIDVEKEVVVIDISSVSDTEEPEVLAEELKKIWSLEADLALQIKTETDLQENQNLDCDVLDITCLDSLHQIKHEQIEIKSDDDIEIERTKVEAQNDYKCGICSFNTRHKDRLTRHLLTHDDSHTKIHRCDTCSFETVHINSLRRHQNNHDSIVKHKCNLCTETFRSKRELVSHVFRSHNNEGNSLASHEINKNKQETTLHKSNLNRHLTTHDIASGELNSHESIKHEKVTEDRLAKIYSCNICNFKTVHKGSLSRHRFAHDNVTKYKCKLCTESFKSKRQLDSHIFKAHKNERKSILPNKIYKCKSCSYETLRNDRLKTHVITCQKDVLLEMLTCDFCTFQTYSKASLDAHIHIHLRVHECNSCEKDFSSKESLAVHILAKHKDNKDMMKSITSKVHKCPECSFTNIKMSNMKRHVKGHHQNKSKA